MAPASPCKEAKFSGSRLRAVALDLCSQMGSRGRSLLTRLGAMACEAARFCGARAVESAAYFSTSLRCLLAEEAFESGAVAVESVMSLAAEGSIKLRTDCWKFVARWCPERIRKSPSG